MSAALKILVLAIAGAAALAASANPAPTGKIAEIIQKDGQPLAFRFADGREAVLKVSSVDSEVVSTQFKITDNTCSDRQNMTCAYKFALRRYFAAMVWTKHPDASRVGQIVKRGAEYPGQPTMTSFDPLSADYVLVAGLDFSATKTDLGRGLPAHEIQCDDFSWLPGASKEAPNRLHLSRWDGENNEPNPETGTNENRTNGGAFGLDLMRVDAKTLRVTKVSALSGGAVNLDILTLAPTGSLTMLSSDGEICQTGISSKGVTEILPIYNKLEAKRPDPASEKPYILGSNGFTKHSFFKFALSSWIQQNEYLVYQ